MVNYCRVFGCHNRSDRERDKQFYRLPEIITRECEKTRQLSEERRRLWLAKLNQDLSGKNLKNVRICSDHFPSGEKAQLFEKDSPDWIPTLNMGHITPKHTPSPQTVNDRFKRRKFRHERTSAARALLSLCEVAEEEINENNEIETGISTQTHLSSRGLDSLTNELSHLQQQNDEMREQLKNIEPYSPSFFIGNDEKVKYFTGLPTYAVLKLTTKVKTP